MTLDDATEASADERVDELASMTLTATAYGEADVELTHEVCGQLLATTETRGIDTYGYPVCKLSARPTLAELRAASVGHSCPGDMGGLWRSRGSNGSPPAPATKR